jgi:asparagine synthase (glutamine-hydrolysing)
MCGIAGLLGSALAAAPAADTLTRMAACMVHRGPDGSGVLWHERDRVGLAHRRLAVLDRSPAGDQPMESASGRFAVVLNGEIVNAPQLAAELANHGSHFRGHSDTEVLLAAVEAWGLTSALERMAGMFALALHDRQERCVHLVRDRLGVKPLHYAWIGGTASGTLAFASEVRALTVVPGWRGSVDPVAVADVLAHACVQGRRCIWRNMHRVMPGQWVRVDTQTGRMQEHVWWNGLQVAAAGCANPLTGTDEAVTDEGSMLLAGVVREHLLSDVPVGCMLSGGVDSAVVAGLAARAVADVRTFTLGVAAVDFDERAAARATAAALGMAWSDLMATESQLTQRIRDLVTLQDEPFADSSLVASDLLCGQLRPHATVALSGDGGDEIFGGYNRHVHAVTAGGTARRAVAWSMGLLSHDAWNAVGTAAWPLLPTGLRVRELGDKITKWRRLQRAGRGQSAYEALTALWPADASPVRGDPPDSWWDVAAAERLPDALRRMQWMDQHGYLADDALVKVDRAGMRHGLEVRVPLLDHRIVEWAWRLPPHMKVRAGRGKWLLRRVLAGLASPELPALRAPKTGLALPIGRLLRGPLRAWADDLLSPARLGKDPLLDAPAITRAWHDLCRGSDASQHRVWAALVYAGWSHAWGAAP